MSATAKECGVCQEVFDEESRCPRIFKCFHTLCTTCIDQLIRNNTKKCPFCRKNFKANNTNDVTINHTLLEFMRFISLQEPNFKKAKKDPATPREMRINDLKKEIKETSCHHLLNCQKAEKQIEKTIKEVINQQKGITQENNRLENDVLPKIQDVISRNNRTSEELNKINTVLHDRLKEIQIKNMQLEDVKGKLDACTANTFKETGLILDEVEESNTGIRSWIENFKELMYQEEKILQTTKKKMKRTKELINIILDVLSSREERDRESDPIPGTSAMAIQEELLPGHITAEALREMSDPVKHLVEQGRIFAVQHEGRRCARISITSDKLCLHHLREEPLPPNVHILEHDAVMRLVDPSSRLTFLELGVDGSAIGTIYIRLTNDTKGARQFSYLCTGEKGPSYANTNSLGVDNKGDDIAECVSFGDYENNDGSGGKALVPGLSEDWDRGGEYEQPWVAGTVEGVWGCMDLATPLAAQFIIYTRDNPEGDRFPCIGRVEDGLQVLREAICHYPDIRDVMIKECGIILSC